MRWLRRRSWVLLPVLIVALCGSSGVALAFEPGRATEIPIESESADDDGFGSSGPPWEAPAPPIPVTWFDILLLIADGLFFGIPQGGGIVGTPGAD